ncbi:MAG: quinate 5-dehydrogenase [Gudongella sp.]|jgi:hypothetical protein|nr:quinate 5-dehydrogenase [Gudongella sp.]
MRQAVSISIGSSKRNGTAQVELAGEMVKIERIGTDGDMEAAAKLFKELDGKVDAFGLGGTDLDAIIDGKAYPFYSIRPMVRYVEKTPIVDGGGVKNTLENKICKFLDSKLGDYLEEQGRRVLIPVGIDRWGLASSFANSAYDVIYGDLMFALGIPIPVRKISTLKNVGRLIMPVAGRVPFKLFYPLGEKQEKHVPKNEKYFHWATIIAGDFHYIKRHMPLDGMGKKIIVTNTTTSQDVEFLKQAGIKYLITTTPIMGGRTFGTNMVEAALVAASGKNRALSWEEIDEMLESQNIGPQLQELN